MWDTFKDFMNAFFGLAVLFVPLFFAIKNPKKNWVYIIFLVVCAILLFWLGIDKIKRDALENENKSTQLNQIQNTVIEMSKSQAEFKENLKKVGIGWDTVSNKPIVINKTLITNIENAETVNIH
ncbi:hypothetical protein [Pollutibacter soli]|uniref:hypothetical protein n=1 Tax=Pollutibacter soli TaxID=3034157 RepID=UPI0030136DDC